MQKFLDVNVWLPLVWQSHSANAMAKDWASKVKQDFVICRVVQMALLRHLTNPAIMGSEVLTNNSAAKLVQAIVKSDHCHFAAEPKQLEMFFPKLGESPKPHRNLWTDAYLASFAMAGGYEFVTFDKDFKKFKKAGLQLELLNFSP